MLTGTFGGCLRLARAVGRETCFITSKCVSCPRISSYHSQGRRALSRGRQSIKQHDCKHPTSRAARPRSVSQSQLIHPQDLPTTLEEHRAFNRASLIRRTNAKAPGHAKDEWRYSGKNVVKTPSAQIDTAPRGPQNAEQNRSGFAQPTTSNARKGLYVENNFEPAQSRRTALQASPVMSAVALQPHRPYKTSITTSMKNRGHRLDDEMKCFQSWISLKPWEVEVRSKLTADLMGELQDKIGDITFKPFGSSITGLDGPRSDIDIAIHVPSLQRAAGERGASSRRPEAVKAIEQKLKRICEVVGDMGAFQVVEIVQAQFPLVRVVHKKSKIDFQIVSSNTESLVAEKVKDYMEEYPNLKTTFMVAKEILVSRNWHKPRYGGLSSYPLFMTVVGSVKLLRLSRDLATHQCLLRFFEFLAAFDTAQMGLSIEPPALYKKRQSLLIGSSKLKQEVKEDPMLYWQRRLGMVNKRQPLLLSMQDPADMTNDLGRRSHRITDIQQTFRGLARTTHDWLLDPSGIDACWSPLDVYFGNSLNAIRLKREAARRYAEKIGLDPGYPELHKSDLTVLADMR